MTRIGVITGLAREAKCLGVCPDPNVLHVLCVGGDSNRAAEAARILVSRECDGLVSFGIAGGLAPSLVPGAVVIAVAVVGKDNFRYPCNPTWRRRLMAVLANDLLVSELDVLGSEEPVLLSKEKHCAYEESGAGAVDMESLAIARVAAEHEVPFLTVRAIADPAGRDLPSWVPGLINRDGRPRIRGVIKGASTHLHQLPLLLKLGIDSERAFASLRRVALVAGPVLQFSA